MLWQVGLQTSNFLAKDIVLSIVFFSSFYVDFRQFPESLVQMGERLEKLVPLFIFLDDDMLIHWGIQWQRKKGFERVNSILILLFHHKKGTFEKQPPLLNNVLVYVDGVTPVQNMRCLIKILVFYFDFHHHLDWSSHALLVRVLLERLLKRENCFDRLFDLVVCYTL